MKRHLISALQTFVAGFLLGISPLISSENIGKATVFALVMAGVRAGIKALYEAFILPAPQEEVQPLG